jgi:hypothetical protein
MRSTWLSPSSAARTRPEARSLELRLLLRLRPDAFGVSLRIRDDFTCLDLRSLVGLRDDLRGLLASSPHLRLIILLCA